MGSEGRETARAVCSEKELHWGRQVGSGCPWLELGGSGSPCILAVGTEVVRAGGGTNSVQSFLAVVEVSHVLVGSAQHTYLAPHHPGPQFPHLKGEGAGSQHFWSSCNSKLGFVLMVLYTLLVGF